MTTQNVKKFTQDVFKNQDPKLKYATVDQNGETFLWESPPKLRQPEGGAWDWKIGKIHLMDDNYDTTNWDTQILVRLPEQTTGIDRAEFNHAQRTTQCSSSETLNSCLPYNHQFALAGMPVVRKIDYLNPQRYYLQSYDHDCVVTICGKKELIMTLEDQQKLQMAYSSIDEALREMFPNGMKLGFLDRARYIVINGSLEGVRFQTKDPEAESTDIRSHTNYVVHNCDTDANYVVIPRPSLKIKSVPEYASVNGHRIKLGVKNDPKYGNSVWIATSCKDSFIFVSLWLGVNYSSVNKQMLEDRLIFTGETASDDAKAMSTAIMDFQKYTELPLND